jgi:signal transduction histidine kinase
MGAWLHYELRASIKATMEDMAELIAKEIKSALYEPLGDYLTEKAGGTEKKLGETIRATVEKSETIVSLAIVSTSGAVKTSSDASHIGNQVKIPTSLFEHGNDPKLISEFTSLQDSGMHTLWSPIVKDGRHLGYLRIDLRGRDVAKIFNRLYSTFIITLLLGLAAVLFLDLLLHLELGRITTGLTSLLQAAARGDVDKISGDRDEFTQIRHTASELGNEIKTARNNADRVRRKFGLVANHGKTGIMLVDKDKHLEFINERAKLLIAPNEEIDRYLDRLDFVMDALKPAMDFLAGSDKLTHSQVFKIEDGEKPRRLHADLYRSEAGDWQGCVILLHDRDDSEAMNRDLQQAAHSRSLSMLLLGVIHDIKAPLNAMMMNLELLSDAVDSRAGDDAKEPRYIAVLKSELERLNRLIMGLYSQTLTDTAAKSEIDLGDLVADFCRLLKPRAKSRRVNLQCAKPEQPLKIHGYPGQIKQAVLNIMLNALESMPHGGDLTVTFFTGENTAHVKICDTGPGIPSTLKKLIFDLHFTTKPTGTGIGLYVSRHIIENHGGVITVESEYGKGACFEICLPMMTEGG